MKCRTLGQSDLQVSVISMGCWAIADDQLWGPQDEDQAIAAIRAALDTGINFFDTAEGYGNGRSEEIVGKALTGERSRAIIATKVLPSHLSPADLRAACEASLKRLRTDYIDVYYIHWSNPTIPIADTMGELARLKTEGKVRVIGCSNFGACDLGELLQYGRAEVNQLPYSLLWRAIEYEILPACVANQISIACWAPLMESLLTDKFTSADAVPPARARTRHFSSARAMTRHGEPGAERETFETLANIRRICAQINLPLAQVALAWLIQRIGVASIVVGVRNPEQARVNAAAASLDLPDEIMRALDDATADLKTRMGTNADLWQSDSRIH